jgi:hypothetical protein
MLFGFSPFLLNLIFNDKPFKKDENMNEVTPEETLRKGLDDESNEGFFLNIKTFIYSHYLLLTQVYYNYTYFLNKVYVDIY